MDSPLINFIKKNDTIKALDDIARGNSNPEIVDTNGRTALIYACIKGIPMSDVALALIQTNNSKPEQVDNSGKTALFYACDIGTAMREVALALIRTGNSNPGIVNEMDSMTALLYACLWEMNDVALALIETGNSNPGIADADGLTALIYACKGGMRMSDVALALIETGDSNPTQIDTVDRTALIYACMLEMSDVALALIATGDSNPSQVDRDGRTALSYAQEHETMPEVVELLLQATPTTPPTTPPASARVAVNALQVHQAASKINYDKLNEFLSTRIQPITRPQDYGVYIKDTINTLITESDEPPAKKQELTVELQRIYEGRLILNYSEKSEIIRDSISNSLEYVKLQPPDFKQMYVETFVKDCVHAYEGADGMTCANGALERIIFSLVPACKTSDNPDYTTLIILISGPELIINSIIDWYKSHNPDKPENVGAVAFPKNTKREVKKDDLRQYLLGLYPGLPGLIEQLIISHADALDDDDFTYGGKRRNSRKRRKRQKNKTRKKSYKKVTKKGTKKLQKKSYKKVTKKLQKSYKNK
jgi:ankyrin repeat protein